MTAALPLRSVLDRQFRANPTYTLIEQEDLPPAQRDAFGKLGDAPDHYGLWLPGCGSGSGIKAVDHATAHLIQSLRSPGPFPAEYRVGPRSDLKRQIAGLVLDGVLEIAWEGGFVTGPSACRALLPTDFEVPEPEGLLGKMSWRALRTAQELPTMAPHTLSAWLYAFGRLPLSPAWAHRFGTDDHIAEALGINPDGRARVLEGSFVAQESTCWRMWNRPGIRFGEDDERPTFKLYVSPDPGALPEVFPTIARAFAEAGAPAFKMGKDALGLLRPDKIVAYFSEQKTLDAVAEHLRALLEGCPAHGVPFTAAFTDGGLLSWGMDPPRSESIPGWRNGESWRLWVANYCARALLDARIQGSGSLEPWQYAVVRLGVEGVDPRTWLPDSKYWN